MKENETFTAESAAAKIEQIRAEIAKVFIGQSELVEHSLITLIAGGHLLVEGAPGLGKTLLVRALSAILVRVPSASLTISLIRFPS